MNIRSKDKTHALRMALGDIHGIINEKTDTLILQDLLEKFDSTGELSTRNIYPDWINDLIDSLNWLYEQGQLHARENVN